MIPDIDSAGKRPAGYATSARVDAAVLRGPAYPQGARGARPGLFANCATPRHDSDAAVETADDGISHHILKSVFEQSMHISGDDR